MLFKGKQASDFARKPKPSVWAVLAFGEDSGLASDAAISLIKAWTPKGANMDVTTLDDDSIKKDPSLLFDGLEAVSLLGDPRVIRVRTSGDKIAALLIEAIQKGESQERSKLRAAAETAQLTACLQLFADEAGDIEKRVQDALKSESVQITPEALALFVGDLPGHRNLANSEIEKLALYARGLGRPLDVDDIRSLSATDVDHNLSAAIRAALDGKPALVHTTLDRLAVAGTSGISILRSLQFETMRMLDAQSRLASGQSNPGMKLRPPVWQSEWGLFSARLRKWPTKRLMRVMERIYEAEQQAKSGSGSADPVIRVLMNEIARAAEIAS